MRWVHAASLLLVAVLAVCLGTHSKRQELRIDALSAELEIVQTQFPTWLRSELSAQEERIVLRIEALLAKR